MTDQTENEIRIRRFFFGQMAGEERFEFEQRFAADFALLEELRMFEDDLIEKYVRGWLKQDEKTEFEAHFLNSEKRRAKVEFTRRLLAELEVEETENALPETSLWRDIAGWLTFPRLAGATAFAIVIVLFGSWFWLGTRIPVDDSIVRTNANSNSETDVNRAAPKDANVANRPIEPVNKPVSSPTPSPEPTKTPVRTIPEYVPNPVLALVAGTLRDGGEVKELNLPKNARGATFRLSLKSVDYKSFRATVTDGNGRAVFTSGTLGVSKNVVTLTVPAKNLESGDYRIKLSGKNPEGENESVADFQFRVN